MIKHTFKLNDEKTEFTVAVSSSVKILTTREPCGGVTMKPVIYVSNLGVQVDIHKNKRYHVDAVFKKCDFHLKRLNSTRRYNAKRVCHLLVTALEILIIDYCNAFRLERYHQTRLQKKHTTIFSYDERILLDFDTFETKMMCIITWKVLIVVANVLVILIGA